MLAWRPRADTSLGVRLVSSELTAMLRPWLAASTTVRQLHELVAWARAAPSIVEGSRDDGSVTRFLQAAIDDGVLVGFRLPFQQMRLPATSSSRPSSRPPPGPAPVGERTWFEIQLVDELGEPIAGVDVVFSLNQGKIVVPTAGDGVARVDGVTDSFTAIAVDDVLQLKDTLRARWDAVRDPLEQPYLHEEDGVVVRFATGEFSAVPLASEERAIVSVHPRVVLTRLRGLFFDTNKAFLLPTAIESIKRMVEVYDRNPDSHLLVVGHTDTTADPSYNDPLSLERADSMRAYLTDDIPVWLQWYGASVSWEKRWGAREDKLMIGAMPDFADKPIGQRSVRWYQRTRGLVASGVADMATREVLIGEYMGLDRTSVPAGTPTSIHGCGETFPLDDTLAAVDDDAVNPNDDLTDRRVEVWFFDRYLGVQPTPPGSNSHPGDRQYESWRRRATERHDFLAGTIDEESSHIHHLLRTNSSCYPIIRVPYELHLPAGVVRGETDDDGLIVVEETPAGDFVLEVGGVTTIIASLPADATRAPHTVARYYLATTVPGDSQ